MFIKKNYLSINKIKIKHGFFTRLNGLSKNNFNSLNCSISNGDNKKLVLKNRSIAMKNLHLENKKLVLIKQTHSSKVIMINKNNLHKNLDADGMITSLNGVALGILTADCAPIFIFDNSNKFVCSLHSGWRGTLNNISKKAIMLFEKYDINRNNLSAIIGPCLGFSNYEVEKDFEKKFINKDIKYSQFFKKKNNMKSYFNIRGLINYQLAELGLNKVYNINRDTYSNKNLFFSHRRSNHEGDKTTGRLINLISLT